MRGCSEPKIIVKRTIKEANATIVYPTLTRTNYDEWAMLIKVNMEVAEIWYAVEFYPDEEVEYLATTAGVCGHPALRPVKIAVSTPWEALCACGVGCHEDNARWCRAHARVQGAAASP
jgi:hypothetical protein